LAEIKEAIKHAEILKVCVEILAFEFSFGDLNFEKLERNIPNVVLNKLHDVKGKL